MKHYFNYNQLIYNNERLNICFNYTKKYDDVYG